MPEDYKSAQALDAQKWHRGRPYSALLCNKEAQDAPVQDGGSSIPLRLVFITDIDKTRIKDLNYKRIIAVYGSRRRPQNAFPIPCEKVCQTRPLRFQRFSAGTLEMPKLKSRSTFMTFMRALEREASDKHVRGVPAECEMHRKLQRRFRTDLGARSGTTRPCSTAVLSTAVLGRSWSQINFESVSLFLYKDGA